MSAYSGEFVTEGWVVVEGHFVKYPNYGPFYRTEKAARRACRKGTVDRVMKATVTYVECD